MTKQELEKELTEHISTMDIPSGRKEFIEHNLLWMTRNLGIKNGHHPKFERAMMCIRFILHIINTEKKETNAKPIN